MIGRHMHHRTGCRQQHCSRRRGGRHNRKAAAAHQPIDQQARKQRNHPCLRRRTSDAGIGHRFWQQQAGDGEPGNPVSASRRQAGDVHKGL